MAQWLHYVGLKSYTLQQFIDEAISLGVQRAISLTHLKRISWGDVVFLALHTREKVGDRRVPCARIFGFFTVEGISYRLPPKANRILKELIPIEKSKVPTSGDVIERGCGRYAVAEINYIDPSKVSIQDIAKAIGSAVKAIGWKGRYKLFITGTFYKYGPLTLKNQPFFRGYKKLVPELPVEFDPLVIAEATRLASYKKREYDPELYRRREGAWAVQ